jgi:hypothetical protein
MFRVTWLGRIGGYPFLKTRHLPLRSRQIQGIQRTAGVLSLTLKREGHQIGLPCLE